MAVDQTEPSAQTDHELPRQPVHRRPGRRLGPLEYALIALVAVGIVITVAMAVFDPPA
jgi:hypothetical protein